MTTTVFFRWVALAMLMPVGATLSVFAQPAGARDGFEISARSSHTGSSDFTAAGSAGSVSIDSFDLRLRASTSLTPATRLLYGLEWSRHALDRSGPQWLPGRLQALAVPLGLAHSFEDRWRLLVTASPRIGGAEGDWSTAGFDLPVLALASYAANPELTWSFGLRYGARSEIKVLPIAGVSWQFTPKWNLRLAWPDSGLSYRATPQLSLRAVASFHGGDFRLADDPRPPTDRTGVSLDDSWLEYLEMRVGLAVEYTIGRAITLRVDLGKVVVQRFEYFDRDLRIEGGSPAYFALGVVGRF